MNDHKGELRETKRVLKQKGNQRVRRQAKRQLAEDPNEATEIEVDYSRYSTTALNGEDHDATRRR